MSLLHNTGLARSIATNPDTREEAGGREVLAPGSGWAPRVRP